MDLCLAVDIGGTKLAAGLVTVQGELLDARRVPTPRTDDADELFAALAGARRRGAQRGNRPGWRVPGAHAGGVRGRLRRAHGPRRGTVSPLNIPAWRDFPLRARLERGHRARRRPGQRRQGVRAGRGLDRCGPQPPRLSGHGGVHRGGWRHRRRQPAARRRIGERRPRRSRDRRARRSPVRVRGAGLSRSRSVGHRHRGGDRTSHRPRRHPKSWPGPVVWWGGRWRRW